MGAETAIVAACVAIGFATLFFLFFLEEDPADSSPLRTRLDQLFERRDTIYENLRDLRFEYRSGKFSEQDFEQMKQSLEGEAAQVLAEMEKITGGAPARGPRAAERKPSA